jgi:uronate dehydrogenase
MRIVLTGAAGLIGRALREPLRERAERVRLVDREAVEPADGREEAFTADLSDLGAARRALAGTEAVVHLAGIPAEDAFERLLEANVRATYNVFEAARLGGVERVVLASSNHATGFYRRDERVSPADRPRPDSLYGVTKVFGEALGSLYADKFGLAVVALRIGAFAAEPPEGPGRPMWISPGDTFRLVWAALTAPDVRFEVVYGVSATGQTWWENDAAARRIGYAPVDSLDLRGELDGDAPQGGEFARRDHHGGRATG